MKTFNSNNIPSIINALELSDDNIKVILNKPEHFDKIVALSTSVDGKPRIDIVTTKVSSKIVTAKNRIKTKQFDIDSVIHDTRKCLSVDTYTMNDLKNKLLSTDLFYYRDNALIRNDMKYKESIGKANDYKYYLIELSHILSCIMKDIKSLTIGFQSNYNDHHEITDDRSLNPRNSDNCTFYWDIQLELRGKSVTSIVYNLPYRSDQIIVNALDKIIACNVMDWLKELPTFVKEYALVRERGMTDINTLTSLTYIAGDSKLSVKICKYPEVLEWFKTNYESIVTNHITRKVFVKFSSSMTAVPELKAIYDTHEEWITL